MSKRTALLAIVFAAGTTMAFAEDAPNGSGKQDTGAGPARVTPAPGTVSSGKATPEGGDPKTTGKAGAGGAAKPDH